MQRYTIANFTRDFPNDDTCLEWLKNHLYPDGIFCETCGRITKHHKVATRRSYSCDYCGHHVHPTAGTVFEKSTTPLKLWFHAIFLMSSTRCGISAKQIERETGVTYKTAWRMFHQIRSLLNEDTNLLTGEVEIDETYIGGKKHGTRGRGAEGKTPVIGAAQRKGKVIAKVVSDVKSSIVVPFTTRNISRKATLYTDEFPSYDHLTRFGYNHKRIEHATKVYVNGNVHTNSIEGFWSLIKRGISGVYHAVSPKYLQSYLDEYTFRYNHRKDEEAMFKAVLSQITTC
jgi:transposase